MNIREIFTPFGAVVEAIIDEVAIEKALIQLVHEGVIERRHGRRGRGNWRLGRERNNEEKESELNLRIIG